MAVLRKLLLIGSFTRGMYGQWRLQRLLSGVATAAGLTIVIAMLASTAIISGFAAAYLALIAQGTAPIPAILLLGSVLLLMALMLIAFAGRHMRRLHGMEADGDPSSLGRRGSLVIDAFFEGLMAEDKQSSYSH